MGREEPSSRPLWRSAGTRLRSKRKTIRCHLQAGAKLFSSHPPGALRTKIDIQSALRRPAGVGASSGTGRPRGECGQESALTESDHRGSGGRPRHDGAQTGSRHRQPPTPSAPLNTPPHHSRRKRSCSTDGRRTFRFHDGSTLALRRITPGPARTRRDAIKTPPPSHVKSSQGSKPRR